MAVVAVQDDDLWRCVACIGVCNEMFQPFHEHIAVSPTIGAAVVDRL